MGERRERCRVATRKRESKMEKVDVGTFANVRAPWLWGIRGGIDSNHGGRIYVCVYVYIFDI